jgi:hypothetical protein
MRNVLIMLTEYFVEHPFPLALGNVKSPDTPSLGMLILIKMSLHKAGERQPRSPVLGTEYSGSSKPDVDRALCMY